MDSDPDIVLEVVFAVVEADSEFFCNILTVDGVKQRVHFVGNKFVNTDVVGVRLSC